jgi:hypothetical protein
VPHVFADYMRRLEPAQQDYMIRGLFEGKSAVYASLNSRGKGARVLFHLHMLLADLLLPRPAKDVSRTFAFQLVRAYSFREHVDATIPFADLLTPALTDALCGPGGGPRTCAAQCGTNTSCRTSCEAHVRDLAPKICTP